MMAHFAALEQPELLLADVRRFFAGQVSSNGKGRRLAVGIAGMNSLATVASRPVTPATNITGNTGPVLVGGGNLNSGSLNPTNPAPKVCSVSNLGVLTCP